MKCTNVRLPTAVIFIIPTKGTEKVRFNGENMFSGEGYKQKQSVKKAIESIKKNVPDAEVDDQT